MNGMRMRWALRFLVLGLVLLAAVSFAVMTLWNWLLPPLFGWPAIGLAKAAGLLVLCRVLFGGLRGGLRGHGGMQARRRFAERWESMSAEERERFRAGMRGCCGSRRARGDDAAPPPAAASA